jgi:hypothetical protein
MYPQSHERKGRKWPMLENSDIFQATIGDANCSSMLLTMPKMHNNRRSPVTG